MAAMAALMFAIAIAHFLLSCILCAGAEHECENISILNLPVPSRDYPKRSIRHVAVCVHGDELLLSRLWASVKVSLRFNKSNVHSYEADSCEALNPANRTWASLFQSILVSSNNLDHMIFKLSPFKTSCFAVNGLTHDATWSAEFQAIDWQFPAAFFAGLIIFYNAERLSRNSLFFYSSGVSLGLIMSLLLVVYILHRLVPGRGGAYAVLFGGCSVGLYLIQWTIGNLKDLLLNHNQWVIGYFVIVGVISFCVCYYYGPVTSDRGLDLIRWMLQSVGLLLLYMGTRSDEVSIALVVIVFLSHKIRGSGILLHFVRLLPHKWVSYRVYYFFFPPKHKFLSEEEYVVQGSEETRLALQDLREYCNSPECNAWRTISRLKNPTRFAKFVSTGQHYLEEEVKSYEDDPSPWLTSDEDEENRSIDG